MSKNRIIMTPGSLNRRSTFTMFKKAALTGCMLGVGMIMGAMLFGHQAGMQQDPKTVETEHVVRSKRSVTSSPSTENLNRTPTPSGALYTRWGRSVCPEGALRVYRGVVAGGHSAHTGGGNQYLCMTESPEWGPSIAANGYSWLYGAEYMANDAMFTKTNAPTVINHDANCAVCRSQRQSQLMIPGRKTCLEGWTREYHGFLMSSKHTDKGQRNYICVDHAPEADREGYRKDGGADLWPVDAHCGSLPCPGYQQGKEVTCVVCSQ